MTHQTPPGKATIHVAHFLDGMGVGGTEMNLLRTLRRLDRERFSPSLVCLRPEGALRVDFDALNIDITEARVENLYGIAALHQVRTLADHLRSKQIHVVHAHDRYTNFLAPIAARLAGVPVTITSKRWWFSPLKFRVLNALGYRLSTRVLANSAGVAKSLREYDRVNAARVIVVPNFLEDEAYVPPPESLILKWRRDFHIAPTSLVVGIVASLRVVKDHQTLLRAVGLLKGGWPTLRVVVIGEGEERDHLQALTEALGIASRVHFAGHVPNHPSPNYLFDVATLCSLHEGFPNTLVEAMAAGKPIVATRVGGIPDAVIDGVTGLLVPARNPTALANAIGTMLESRERREAMGAHGLARARQHFAAEAVVRRLEGHYIALLRAKGRLPPGFDDSLTAPERHGTPRAIQ